MFVDFMLIYPMLRWTKRRQAKIPFGRGDAETVLMQLATTTVWTIINHLVMGDQSKGLSGDFAMKGCVALGMC